MDNTQNQRQFLANEPDDVPRAQENQPNHFDTLPDDIFLEILKNLPQSQLQSFALVCHRFSSLIEDRSLWKKVLILGPLKLKPDYVEKLMRRQVQDLTLSNLTIPSPSFRPALEATQPSSWSLKEVHLSNVETYPDDLARMFNKCKQMRKVDLGHIYVNKGVFVALSENTNLEYLCLRCLRGLEPVGLEIVLRNVRKLQEFCIEGCNDTTPLKRTLIVNSICENLVPSLLHLTLSYCFKSLTDRHIAQIARNCPLLESLNVTFGLALTARSTQSLVNLRQLRILNMSMCSRIPPEGYVPLTAMESLVELNIEDFGRNIEERRRIEELLSVHMFKDDGFRRVGTFKTEFTVVKLTY